MQAAGNHPIRWKDELLNRCTGRHKTVEFSPRGCFYINERPLVAETRITGLHPLKSGIQCTPTALDLKDQRV